MGFSHVTGDLRVKTERMERKTLAFFIRRYLFYTQEAQGSQLYTQGCDVCPGHSYWISRKHHPVMLEYSCFKVKFWTWIRISAQYTGPRVLAIHTTRTDTHLRPTGKYCPCWCDTLNPSTSYRLEKLLPMPNTMITFSASSCRSVCICGSGALCHTWVMGQQLLPIWELNV